MQISKNNIWYCHDLIFSSTPRLFLRHDTCNETLRDFRDFLVLNLSRSSSDSSRFFAHSGEIKEIISDFSADRADRRRSVVNDLVMRVTMTYLPQMPLIPLLIHARVSSRVCAPARLFLGLAARRRALLRWCTGAGRTVAISDRFSVDIGTRRETTSDVSRRRGNCRRYIRWYRRYWYAFSALISGFLYDRNIERRRNRRWIDSQAG